MGLELITTYIHSPLGLLSVGPKAALGVGDTETAQEVGDDIQNLHADLAICFSTIAPEGKQEPLDGPALKIYCQRYIARCLLSCCINSAACFVSFYRARDTCKAIPDPLPQRFRLLPASAPTIAVIKVSI